ncbi:MAG TPA: hypothetical protein VLW48_00780 [Candidatus Bathyarchaeia archaeon]|nr:hypothetical protein [Candidatus Bathyarchaeia archaeon]
MKRNATKFLALLFLTIFVLAGSFAYAQASHPTAQASYMFAAATQDQAPAARSAAPLKGSFPVLLAKSIDSKKVKVGDTVVCQTFATLHAQSGVMIPSGSKIIGHVTQAQARSKGDPQSSLAIVFDKFEIAKGEEIPINGVLQAIAPSLGDTGPQVGPATPGTGLGGHGDAGAVAHPEAGPQGFPVGGGAHPMVNSESKGVLGYKNLEMDDNHVITSSGKEVKLEYGTQMMIRAQ